LSSENEKNRGFEIDFLDLKEKATKKEKELMEALAYYKDFTQSMDKIAKEDSKANATSRKFCLPQSIKELNSMVDKFNYYDKNEGDWIDK